MTSTEHTAIVIGAGLTGLSTAWGLHRAGWPVRVLEAAQEVGGVIRSRCEDGFLFETACSSIMVKHQDVWDLLAEVGLTEEVVEPQPFAKNRFIVRNGRPVPVPSGPLSFLTTPLWTTPGKLRLMTEFLVPKKQDDQEESVEAFVCRRVGREFFQYAIDPMTAGIYAGDPAALSVRHAFPKVWALEKEFGSLLKGTFGRMWAARKSGARRFQSRLISFREGIQALPLRLARKLGEAVTTEVQLLSIQPSDQGWQVDFAHPRGVTSITCRQLVVTVPTYRLPELPFPDKLRRSVQSLADLPYAPVATVACGFAREAIAHPLNGFGMLIPTQENWNVLGTLFQSSLFPGRAPEGKVLLSSFLGGALYPQLVLYGNSQARLQIVLETLEKLLGLRGKPVFHRETLWPKGIPQYNLGHDRYLQTLQEIEGTWPGLHLVGNYRDGVGAGDCLHNGLRLAARIASGKSN